MERQFSEFPADANPLTEQLKAVTERITQLVSEAGSSENPKTLQDLAVLQTTLFPLQQQHLLQMQILAHMQNQMKPQQQQEKESDGRLSGTPLLGSNLQESKKQVGSEHLRRLQDFIGPDSLTGAKSVEKSSLLESGSDIIPVGPASSPTGFLKSSSSKGELQEGGEKSSGQIILP